MLPLLALLLSATSVQAWGVDPIFTDEDEDSDVEVAVDQHGSPSRLVRREAASSLYESSGLAQAEDQHDVAIHKQDTVEKVEDTGSADSRVPVKFSWYKFNVTATRGGSTTRFVPASFSKFVLQNVFGQELDLSQSNSAEVYFEGDLGRTDATDAVSHYQKGDADFKLGDSLIIRLKQKDAVASYYWITSKGNVQNDPMAWSMSGSQDGENWVELSAKHNYPTPLERHVIVGSFLTSLKTITGVVYRSEVQPCERDKKETRGPGDQGTRGPGDQETRGSATPKNLTTTPAPEIIYEIVRPPPVQKTVYVDVGNSPCLKNDTVRPCPKTPLVTTTPEPFNQRPCPKLNRINESTPRVTTTEVDTAPIGANATFTTAKPKETSAAPEPNETFAAPEPNETFAAPARMVRTSANLSGDPGVEHTDNVFDIAVVPDFPSTSARKAYLDQTHSEAGGFAFKVALDVDLLLAFILSKTGHKHRGREHELSLKRSKLEFSWPTPGCSDDLPGFTDFASIGNYDGNFSNERNVCGGIQATSVDEKGMSHLSRGVYELFWLAGEFGSQSTYNSGGEVALVKIVELVIADKKAGVEYDICGSKGHINYLGCPKASPIVMVFETPSLFEVPMFCSSSRLGDLVDKYPRCIL